MNMVSFVAAKGTSPRLYPFVFPSTWSTVRAWSFICGTAGSFWHSAEKASGPIRRRRFIACWMALSSPFLSSNRAGQATRAPSSIAAWRWR